MGKPRSETTGGTLTEILLRAWKTPFRTKSDFAREYAELIAMAASDGLITTKIATGMYGRDWLITAKGLEKLRIMKGED
jgi:hypothetical protein